MSIQASHNLQYPPITDIKTAINEKKVDGARSFLFGKIGRTWSGFVSDWAITLFGSKELKGKGFFQRWSILAHAPITLESVKKGHDHAYHFASQLIKQLNQVADSIGKMELNDYQSETLETLLEKNTFKEKLKTLDFKKGLEKFIKKMVIFEKNLREIPVKEHDPITALLNRMTQFIEESEFNPAKRNKQNTVPQTALEKSQQPPDLLKQIKNQKNTLKKAEVKSTEEKKNETKTQSWQDNPAVLTILARRKNIEQEDTESETGEW